MSKSNLPASSAGPTDPDAIANPIAAFYVLLAAIADLHRLLIDRGVQTAPDAIQRLDGIAATIRQSFAPPFPEYQGTGGFAEIALLNLLRDAITDPDRLHREIPGLEERRLERALRAPDQAD